MKIARSVWQQLSQADQDSVLDGDVPSIRTEMLQAAWEARRPGGNE